MTSYPQECIEPPLINGPHLKDPFTRFPPELHTAPFKLGLPSKRAPLLTQETFPHSEILLFMRESPSPLEHAPSPPSRGPLPAPEGPASIPYTRAEVRRPGDCGVQCEGPKYPAL